MYRNDQRWTGLEDYDKLTYQNFSSLIQRIFCEHILDIDRKERDDKRRLRKLRERKNREAFRDLLNEYTNNGKLTHKTKWRKFVEVIQDDPRLLNMVKVLESNLLISWVNQVPLLESFLKTSKNS